MDEITLRLHKGSSDTGGTLPDTAHDVRFIKNVIEKAVERGQLKGVKVVGYEIRNIDELKPSKPKKDVSIEKKDVSIEKKDASIEKKDASID
jgi:hypothetical protein